MSSVMTAIWTAAEGHEGTVAEALRSLREATHAEPGNEVYEVYVDADEPRVFRLFERYVDDDALQAHLDSPHFTEYATLGAIPHLAERVRRRFTTL
jgi:quinol monooxygenase YgiN